MFFAHPICCLCCCVKQRVAAAAASCKSGFPRCGYERGCPTPRRRQRILGVVSYRPGERWHSHYLCCTAVVRHQHFLCSSASLYRSSRSFRVACITAVAPHPALLATERHGRARGILAVPPLGDIQARAPRAVCGPLLTAKARTRKIKERRCVRFIHYYISMCSKQHAFVIPYFQKWYVGKKMYHMSAFCLLVCLFMLSHESIESCCII